MPQSRWASLFLVTRLSGRPGRGGGTGGIARKTVHVALGIALAAAALSLPRYVCVSLLAGAVGLALLVEASRFMLPGVNRLLFRRLRFLLKGHEAGRLTGATFFLLSALLCVLLFDKAVAALAVLFLGCGDAAAAIVGQRAGGPRLAGKSPAGTAAFVAVSVAVVGVLSVTGVVGFRWQALAGAAAGALTELAPLPIDDNATVPVASGVIMSALGAA